jgi:hypothetical protein
MTYTRAKTRTETFRTREVLVDSASRATGILHTDVSLTRKKPSKGIIKQLKFLEFIATRKVKFTRSRASNYLRHFNAQQTARTADNELRTRAFR